MDLVYALNGQHRAKHRVRARHAVPLLLMSYRLR